MFAYLTLILRSVLALSESRDNSDRCAAGDDQECEPQTHIALIAGPWAGRSLSGSENAESGACILVVYGQDGEVVGLACHAGIQEACLEGQVLAVAADGVVLFVEEFIPDINLCDTVGADELQVLAAVDDVLIGVDGLEVRSDIEVDGAGRFLTVLAVVGCASRS